MGTSRGKTISGPVFGHINHSSLTISGEETANFSFWSQSHFLASLVKRTTIRTKIKKKELNVSIKLSEK